MLPLLSLSNRHVNNTSASQYLKLETVLTVLIVATPLLKAAV